VSSLYIEECHFPTRKMVFTLLPVPYEYERRERNCPKKSILSGAIS
jgi:hypothetical protein